MVDGNRLAGRGCGLLIGRTVVKRRISSGRWLQRKGGRHRCQPPCRVRDRRGVSRRKLRRQMPLAPARAASVTFSVTEPVVRILPKESAYPAGHGGLRMGKASPPPIRRSPRRVRTFRRNDPPPSRLFDLDTKANPSIARSPVIGRHRKRQLPVLSTDTSFRERTPERFHPPSGWTASPFRGKPCASTLRSSPGLLPGAATCATFHPYALVPVAIRVSGRVWPNRQATSAAPT